eukprot:scaffold55304_cov63-Phaeocystis_antarctica.AAC.2
MQENRAAESSACRVPSPARTGVASKPPCPAARGAAACAARRSGSLPRSTRASCGPPGQRPPQRPANESIGPARRSRAAPPLGSSPWRCRPCPTCHRVVR